MASIHYHTLPLHNHHGHLRLTSPTHPTFSHRPPSLLTSPLRHSITCTTSNTNNSTPKQPPKTLFPGGYKRPEIRVPNVVLEVECGEVVGDKDRVVKVVDEAVREVVGVVVLKSGGGGSGRVMYDAACLLKAVIRDRAYFLVDERVDVATAVNASGVVLSDQ
ncbi:probable transmembrane GTPase FZO-like protein, chloroplastic, partial [Tanacetum coccineum]